jgi:hypothetical protein
MRNAFSLKSSTGTVTLIDSSLSEAEAKTYLVNAGLPNN